MAISEINQLLSYHHINLSDLFPSLIKLKHAPFQFDIDFGLSSLPIEPGILMIR